MQILLANVHENFGYKTVTGVAHASLPEFLSRHVNRKLIDLLNLDIEGAEINLIKMFAGSLSYSQFLPTSIDISLFRWRNSESHNMPDQYGAASSSDTGTKRVRFCSRQNQ